MGTMKISSASRSHRFCKGRLAGGAVVCVALPALAIEPPVESAPIPPQEAPSAPTSPPRMVEPAQPAEPIRPEGIHDRFQHQVEPLDAARPAAPRPYIGVILDEIPPLLASHLQLGERDGMVVRELVPGGPAEQAGIQRHDIITRFNGERYASSEELRGLVEANAIGDAVELGVIRGGESLELELALGEAPQPMAEARPAFPGNRLDGAFHGIPDNQAERIREAIERNLRAFEEFENFEDLERGVRDVRPMDARGDLLRRLEQGLGGAFDDFEVESSSTFRFLDDQGSVEMSSRNGGKELRLYDKQGNLQWEGPYDTEQDKAAVPDEFRGRLESFNLDFDGAGMRFRFGAQPFRPFDRIDPLEMGED